MKYGLALDMLRQHRWAYAGLALVLVASSTLVGGSFVLLDAGRQGDIDLSGLTDNEAAKLLGLVASGQFVSGFIAGLCAFVAMVLVSQTMSFVVEGRRRELALLRLAGAEPRQVTGMILIESTVLGLICSLTGALLSLPLVGPYADLLSRQNNWPSGVPVRIHVTPVVVCVIVMTLVSLAGAFSAAHRIGRAAPIDAIRSVTATVRRMPLIRWVQAGIGLATVVSFSAIPTTTLSYQVTTAAVGGGAVLFVSALAPIIVPTVARVFGSAITAIAPGSGIVAREHISHDARRTAALATPIIVLLGLGAVFGMLAQTGRAESSLGLRELTNTRVVVDVPIQHADDGAFTRAQELPEVGAITRVQRLDDWSWNALDAQRGGYPAVMGIDPESFSHFVPATLNAGNIDDIGGTNVAAIVGQSRLGEVLHLKTPAGKELILHVVATVNPTSFVHGTILMDQRSLPEDAGDTEDTWLVSAGERISDDQLIVALKRIAPSAAVMPRTAWIDQFVARTVANQAASILLIVGGAALLALLSLAQSTLTSVRERQAELELLIAIGARQRSVIGLLVAESAIISTTAAFLAIAVTAVVYAKMSIALHSLDSALSPVIPFGVLSLILVACVITNTTFAAVGARLAVRRSRTSAR